MSIAKAHLDAMKRFLTETPAAESEVAAMLREQDIEPQDALGRLEHGGEYPPRLLLDLVCQLPSARYSPEHAAAALLVRCALFSGRLVIIPVGPVDLAGADVDRDGNQARLDRALKRHGGTFRACVTGEMHDRDGWVEWGSPLRWAIFENDRERAIEIEPRRVDLEIGTTSGGATFLHIQRGMGVARWPYGYQRLFLLVPVRAWPLGDPFGGDEHDDSSQLDGARFLDPTMPTKKRPPTAGQRKGVTAAEQRKRDRAHERVNKALDVVANSYADGNKTLQKELVKAIREACQAAYGEHHGLK